MNDKERRASKYLPFDSLKGLKESIEKEDTVYHQEKIPYINEEEKLNMDLMLFECYSQNKAIIITYIREGKMLEYSGVIKNIDVLNRQITLLPKKKFSIDDIYRISLR